MAYFIRDGVYMEGQLRAGDIECDARPTVAHEYVGGGVGNTSWQINAQIQNALNRHNADASEFSEFINDSSIVTLLNQSRSEWVTWVTNTLPAFSTAPQRNAMGAALWILANIARKHVR